MKLNIPNRDFAGYIFDCDGTLVDSMPLHFHAWTASFVHNEAPWDWTEDEFYKNAGVPDHVTVADLNLRYGAEICPDLVHDFKEEWYGKRLQELTPVQAVADFARDLHSEGKNISVASGSHLSLVIPSLKQIELDIFDIVVTPADVEKGKPEPDMFLLAAEKMGVDPKDCLVFEDGQAGIDAANAAGMASVFVDSRGMECGERNPDCGSA